MSEREAWLRALMETIHECLVAVEGGKPHDADSWIGLEERIGSEGVGRLWEDFTLGPVAKALDHYCHSAQHDRDIVFDDISMTELHTRLLACAHLIQEGRTDFPSFFAAFR